MRATQKKTIDEFFREGKEIDKALKQAVQRALLEHKKAGNPVVEWRGGKIVWIKPEEITVKEKKN